LELFWTLARGFTVVIHSERRRATPERNTAKHKHSISDKILQHGVTHLQCTPSRAANLIRTPGSSEALRQLRKLLIGGEAFPPALAAQLRQILRADLLNMYGPTETTVWSASQVVGEVNGTVPIGHPIANTEIRILDEQLRPIADGEPGEIFIGGEGVARGYFNRPELTAERFIANPFSLDATARLYRTGDIGRLRADGAIEFLGRADHQIKLHGHRIELGEIESVLSRHPAVQYCVVHVCQAGPDDQRLAAYSCQWRGARHGFAPLSGSETPGPHDPGGVRAAGTNAAHAERKN
jgi:non-ribosomal peptide synthetase component F